MLFFQPITRKTQIGNSLHKFSRAWHLLHVFPRLALVARFPALGSCYVFSLTGHWLHVFLRLLLAIYMFSVQLKRFAIENHKTKTKVLKERMQ